MGDATEHRKKADALFGQIALKLGIVSKAQIEVALGVQKGQTPPKPIGLILMEQGVVKSSDLEKILQAQKDLLSRADQRAESARADHLFGKVSIRLKLCSDDQLADCLEVQQRLPKDRQMRLGDIMVLRGVLTPQQVRRVLDVQKGLIMSCPGCDTEYNTVMFKPGVSLQCYRCGSPLRIPIRALDRPPAPNK